MYEKLREHFLYMADLPVEEIHVWFVDSDGALSPHWVAGRGGSRSAALELRELFRRAWEHQAQAIVIAHNHPNRDATPSFDDCEFTERIRDVAGKSDVVFIDHFIVGHMVYSFNTGKFQSLSASHAIAD